MLCQKCGKNTATTHIRTVINGVVSEKLLCASCAKGESYHKIGQNSLMDMLTSMLGDSLLIDSHIGEEKCECCGATFSKIASTGKVGCPKCYEKFRNQLLPYLKRVHSSVNHIGKKPSKEQLIVTPTDKISELRKKLNLLVKNEKYEEAAVVRDEIKKFEEENGNE
ncbi:MAG: UvrB/UvrC motif-containing protein [Acutalibacteraceae bacterium]|nr:UvrB/UvrC motif-containing protein [Acutalibacteraceae bacterium]